jgi:hypothetical protein
MERTLPPLLASLLALLLTGCPTTRWELVPQSAAGPEETYLVIRAAILGDRTDVLYDCLSDRFRSERGLGSRQRFRMWCDEHEGELERLGDLLAGAEAGEVTYASEPAGTRRARLPVTTHGREVLLHFVEVPTFSVTAGFEGYPPERHDFRRSWRDGIRLAEGRIGIEEPLPPALAIRSPAEIEEIRFHHRWLLDALEAPGLGITP